MVAFSLPDHYRGLVRLWLIRPPWPSLLTDSRTIMSVRKLWVFHLLLFLLDRWLHLHLVDFYSNISIMLLHLSSLLFAVYLMQFSSGESYI